MSNLESLDTQTLKYILKNALLDKQEKTQNDFLTFVKAVWPDFVEGKHHRIYAEKLNRIEAINRQHASKTHKIGVRITFISRFFHGKAPKGQGHSDDSHWGARNQVWTQGEEHDRVNGV